MAQRLSPSVQAIRSERVKGLGVRSMRDGYTSLPAIYDELDEVALLHRRLGCPVINITGMALEESAARAVDLVDLVEDRARRFGGRLRRPPSVASDLPRR